MNARELRKELGLTQEQMAQKLECSKAQICMIESGKRSPSLRILKLYGVLSCGRVTLDSFGDQGRSV